MLLVNQIRENYAGTLAGLQKRNIHDAADLLQQVITLDDLRKSTQTQRDQIQAEANIISKQIGALMREGRSEEAIGIREQTTRYKDQIKELEDLFSKTDEELKTLLYTIPNVPHDSVPVGKTPEDNEVVLEHGQIPTLFKGKLPHWDLIKKYDIIDFDLGAKITGAGFPVYKGKGARLQRALINFFLDEAMAAGYTEIQTHSCQRSIWVWNRSAPRQRGTDVLCDSRRIVLDPYRRGSYH